MFRKILIANRGEIAVRIIRACRDLNVSPVAVFSEADAGALHVRLADEAYGIGPAPSVESYLRIERIVEAALSSRAEAIHPGYGFLAENEAFAQAVADAGLVFIGPSADAMRVMGEKTSARRAAVAAGVPVVPGTTEPLSSLDEARDVAVSFGYPIMLKAVAGGGGKGMRLVHSEEDLRSAFETAQAEAAAAFGDPSVYLEKAVERPRHIEIQIFADNHGNYVHLGERECSIQRRHQKVVEECPSPINDAGLREAMGQAAVSAARAVSYSGAGTVEFLVADATRDFYFLEMNTRLQVEHPVTELVTGLDLVREQLTVAAGEPLSFGQGDVAWRGHAIECRVYAENPENNFLPSPGRITSLRVPAGPGVRDDGGVEAGAEVSIYYDPMISKLAAWGRTRAEAIDRLRRALDEYAVGGIKTTLPFFRELVRDPEFIAGRLDTGFIARFFERRAAEPETGEGDSAERRDMALIAAALDYTLAQKQHSTNNHQPREQEQSQWRLAGRAALHKRT
ncbi:MAG TPA: acetyl-CoA carboxylase biotin carboxylase subunit [Pyrinomonadaceae bacterium]|jgi:acetyl-CoA carboxylase biotin carboxylase subunit